MTVIRFDAGPSSPSRLRAHVARDADLPGSVLNALLRGTDPDRIDHALAHEVRNWLGAQTCSLYLIDESGDLPAALPDCARQMLTDASEPTSSDIDIGDGHVCAALHQDGMARRIGVLHCEFDTASATQTAEHGERVASVARVVEQAIHISHEVDALRKSVSQLKQAERLQRALYAIADLASADRDMPSMLHAVHEIVAGLMYAENLFIVLYDRRDRTIRFPYFVDIADSEIPDPDKEYPLDQWFGSLTWHLLTCGHVLMGTIDQLQEQIGEPLPKFGVDCVEWLGVPLIRKDEVVGGIVVQSYNESTRFNEADRFLLTYVAQHILTALERKQAHATLERHVAERTDALRNANRVLQQQVEERERGERLQAALFRIAELTSSLDSEQFHAAMHRVIGSLLHAENFFIALLSDDKDSLTFPYSVDEFDRVRAPRKLGRGLTELVLRSGRPLLVDREGIEGLNASGDVVSSGTHAMCWLGVPLICEDHTVGVLAVQSYCEEEHYTLRDQALLTFVSYHVANALQRKRNSDSVRQAYEQLERRVASRTGELADANRDLHAEIRRREQIEQQLKHEALHDSLTHLPNRTLFLERLNQVLADYQRDRRQLFAVLFLDLDRFKVINDSVGHLVGDELLKDVSQRLTSSLDATDTVARLGGDEFAILLTGIRHTEDAAACAERLIEVLDTPIVVGNKELFTSASIGIALAAPHYRNPDELLRDADAAMYRAKAEGRRRHALFDERLHRDALDLLDLENELRQALSQHEFEPWFQPIINLSDGRITGFEALLRWHHPQRGLLRPADFLSVAEGASLNEQIDWQMFEQVCRAIPDLPESDCFVAINLSSHHFADAGLARRLLELFESHGIDPARMRIEVTERVILDNSAQAQDILSRLRDAGVAIVLDDFGTGYSSLSYLRNFPVQALKIDNSFVSELGDASHSNHAVVRAILALAASMDMQTIAEGIETQAQFDRLVALGCQLGQGYMLGRPKPVSMLANAACVDG